MKRMVFTVLFVLHLQLTAADFRTVGKIERLSPNLDKLLPADAVIEVLAEGFDWSEGPVWVKDGGYLLFNDIPQNTCWRWDEERGLSIYLRPAGYALGDNPPGRELGCNGLYIHPQTGRLVLCDHGNRCIAQLNTENWTKSVLADRFEGKRFNSPNDLVISRSGHIYFTDPPYGLKDLNANPTKELPFSGVFHLAPDGRISLVTKELPFPNGIHLSPDEKTLYVANSGQEAIWMAFDVAEDGSTSNGRIFYDAGELRRAGRWGGCDGMTVDQYGNLWATGPGGVLILSPKAELLGIIAVGEATSNCCFGGPDGSSLFITADMLLCRVKTKVKGAGF
ncbi:MAG: SMP-30/gluconolactonase/LRE family protein [candidate division KSB1 bacterium]|nr:SMP-30/gluconolactonase/LRE family protein [candidate division KSB1 bacterium]